jgi:uncharacterized protein (DUF1501 family)
MRLSADGHERAAFSPEPSLLRGLVPRYARDGQGGTDHGTAGPVLLLGRGVRGGFFGPEPSLTDLDDGDLKADVDFRSIYATLLDQVLDADPTRILNGYSDQIPMLIA